MKYFINEYKTQDLSKTRLYGIDTLLCKFIERASSDYFFNHLFNENGSISESDVYFKDISTKLKKYEVTFLYGIGHKLESETNTYIMYFFFIDNLAMDYFIFMYAFKGNYTTYYNEVSDETVQEYSYGEQYGSCHFLKLDHYLNKIDLRRVSEKIWYDSKDIADVF